MDSATRTRYMVEMATMIDTLKVSKNLEDAGFAKSQADVLTATLADAFSVSREDLVTKDYLKAQLAELRGELRSEIAGVKADIAGVKSELIRWVLGSQAILLAAVVALANFTKLL